MVKPPKEVIETLKNFAKQREIEYEEIKAAFLKIYNEDEVAITIEDPNERSQYAMGMTLSSLTRTGGKGNPYYFRVITTFGVRKFSYKGEVKRAADVIGIIHEADEEGAMLPGGEYGGITIWDDCAEKVNTLEKDKCYMGSFALVKKQPEWGILLQTGEEQVFEEVKAEIVTAEQFYEDNIKDMDIDVTIATIDMSISSNNVDLKRIVGTVLRVDKGSERNTGRPYGLFEILDRTDSTNPLTVWCNASAVTCGVGSKISVTGPIIKSKKDESKFMNAHYVHPLIPTALRLKPKEVPDESSNSELPERDLDNEETDTDDSIQF